jgi:hypothetical protein
LDVENSSATLPTGFAIHLIDDASASTQTLPTTPSNGATLLIYNNNVGTVTVAVPTGVHLNSVASATTTIASHTAKALTYINSTYGWITH